MISPSKKLLEIKENHEIKVRQAIADAFVDVGFPELEEATRWIMQIQPHESDQNFSLIPSEDKLRKNDLGNGSRNVITMGLSVVKDVGTYVKDISQIEADFPDRLKTGFLSEYYRLKRQGHTGDVLFELMCRFAQRGFEREVQRSAGLALLVYLFEKCEVFEK